MARKKKTFDDSPLPREPKYYTKQSRMISNAYKRPYKESNKAITRYSLLDAFKRKRLKDSVDNTTSEKHYTQHVETMVDRNVERHYEKTLTPKETKQAYHVNFSRESALKNKTTEAPLPHINFARAHLAPKAPAPIPRINFQNEHPVKSVQDHEPHIHFMNAPRTVKPKQNLPKINFNSAAKPAKAQTELPKINFDTAAKPVKAPAEIPKINFQSVAKPVRAKAELPRINFQTAPKPVKEKYAIPKINFQTTQTVPRKQAEIPHIHFVSLQLKPKAQKETPHINFQSGYALKPKKASGSAITKPSFLSVTRKPLEMHKAVDKGVTKLTFSSVSHQKYQIHKAKDKAVYKPTFTNLTKDGKATLYAHPAKKAPGSDYIAIKQRETSGFGSLLRGNAINDKIPIELDKSRTQKRIHNEHVIYTIAIIIAIIGLLFSLLFNVMVSLALFAVLLCIGIYGYWTSR